MDLLQQRLKEIDRYMESATVSMADLNDDERKLASELCNHFDLPLGSLMRRADAIRRAGGQSNFEDCLREASQHLILRMD